MTASPIDTKGDVAEGAMYVLVDDSACTDKRPTGT